MNRLRWIMRHSLPLIASSLCCLGLQAQTNFVIPLSASQSSPAVTFNIDTNGTLTETAPSQATLFFPTSFTFPSNPEMLWLPSYNAFRAGNFSGTQWVGQGSAAFGVGTSASGYASTAMGLNSVTNGQASMALGFFCTANGQGSTALGNYSFAAAQGATALGQSAASGLCSTAAGTSTASGVYSFASGYNDNASGNYSTAFGRNTSAVGESALAAGVSTTATSYKSLVVGTYNVGGGNAGSWVATDPLFEIGNGTSTTSSDALVVYKNGNVAAQGVITAAPGGDIPMYTGN